MTESDHERLADQLEQETDALEQRSERLRDEAKAVREDWERKRRDPNVPGTPPPDESDAEGTREEPPPESEFPAKAPSRETE
jgi:hypothetical protein